jgi:TolB-like protein
MRVLRIFLLIVSFIPFQVRSSETVRTLAVLDFENNTFFNSEEVQSLSKGLGQIMATELGRCPSVRIVERQKLQRLVDEMKLAQAGVTDEENSVQVGKLAGAQILVFGGYMVMPDGKMRMDMRVVEVETGLTLQAGEATGKTRDVLSLVRKLSRKLLKDLELRLTAAEDQQPGNVSLEALTRFSKGVEFEDRGDSDRAAECYRKALAMEPDFGPAKDRLSRLSKKR